MLSVLPSRQLTSQWRECLAIAGSISRNELNHATVNRVKDYKIEHFAAYCDLVREEFKERNFTIGTNTIDKLNNDIDYSNLVYEVKEIQDEDSKLKLVLVDNERLFKNFHNERYLIQCLYSFQEKYDCGMLSDDEWDKICNKFCNLINIR
jgi:uncharacterized protein (TIGR02328 family)